jgi:hypothetical protein
VVAGPARDDHHAGQRAARERRERLRDLVAPALEVAQHRGLLGHLGGHDPAAGFLFERAHGFLSSSASARARAT